MSSPAIAPPREANAYGRAIYRVVAPRHRVLVYDRAPPIADPDLQSTVETLLVSSALRASLRMPKQGIVIVTILPSEHRPGIDIKVRDHGIPSPPPVRSVHAQIDENWLRAAKMLTNLGATWRDVSVPPVGNQCEIHIPLDPSP